MYKRAVKDVMDPFIHMELNLKESQKYVKQGRTYNSSIKNLEVLMWFVYEMEQNRAHRQLGIFAACEREILHIVQDISVPLDQIKRFSEELRKTDISQEKQDVLETVMPAVESAKQDAYYGFWNMRVEISQKSRELLEDAAKSSPEKLKDACKELKLGELLHAMHDAFRDSAGKLDEAAARIESIEPDVVLGSADQRKVWEIMHSRDVHVESGDKEAILLAALKECVEQVGAGYKKAERNIEKAAERYGRIESRIAEKEKRDREKKGEDRPSVKKKIEILQMQQPERRSRVAEEKSKEMMR